MMLSHVAIRDVGWRKPHIARGCGYWYIVYMGMNNNELMLARSWIARTLL